MAVLKREQILEAQDLARQVIPVAKWGGDVIVQEMTAAQRLEFEQLVSDDETQARVLLVAFSAVDEQGKLLFSVDDVKALGEKNFKIIRKLSDAAMLLNRFGGAADADLQENFTSSQG